MNNKNIIIIGDEFITALDIKTKLEKTGFNSVFIEDNNILICSYMDLVILDKKIVDCNYCNSIITVIRGQFATPCFYLTTCTKCDNPILTSNSPDIRYFKKPLKLDEFCDTIIQFLHQK